MIIAVPAIFVLLYLYPYIPGHHLDVCAVHRMLNVGCPGCGMTRSLAAFLHGDFWESWFYHPLGVVVALGLVYIWLKAVYAFLSGKRSPLWSDFETALSRVFVAALFTTWFLRVIL